MRTSISAFFRTLDYSQPKSLSQIEHQLFAKHPQFKQHRDPTKQFLPPPQNVNDLKVTSPFYLRPQHCTNKHCFCPYHRKLRVKQIPNTKHLNRNTYAQTTNNSPKKKVKTEAKNEIKLQTHRNPVQRKQSSKMMKTIKWQGRVKVQSHNYEYDEFLRQFQQILLKKTKLTPTDLHRIKSSVGEIFKYIYTHLEQENEVVQQHISKIEKDRDFTNFYMQRFVELKTRGSKKKQTNEIRPYKQKTTILPSPQEDSRSRNQSRARTKLYQRRQASKKTTKSKHHKLMIQQMLEDIDCGQEIEDEEIQKFAALQLEHFDQNCEFLTKKIKDMDEDILDELLNQIIIKAKSHERLSEANQTNSLKISTLDNIINLIKAKIKQFEQGEAQEKPISFRTNLSSRSINRANSNLEARKNKRLTMMGKTNDSIFAKSGFNQLRKDGKDSEAYNEVQSEMLSNQEQRNQIDSNRQGLKALTICIQGDAENLRTGNASKLKLAKYRRLSHDVFFHRKFLNDQQEQLFSKMKITTLSDIDQQLDNLAFQFAEKKKRIKDIETKIKEFNLRKFMINQKDSLITAKRKIRVLKSLVKNEQFDPEIRVEMVEYLSLMEQQNYVKNRKWAHKKIKNIMQIRPQDQQVQIFDEEYDESNTFYFQQLINQIFGKNSKLLFYDLFKTTYEEKEINFEQHVMDFMKSTLIQQKKYKETRSAKKKTLGIKQKTVAKEPDQKENALMQVGLNNKCLSNYFMINGEENERGTRKLLQEEENYQPTQDRYLDLLNKLAHFGK